MLRHSPWVFSVLTGFALLIGAGCRPDAAPPADPQPPAAGAGPQADEKGLALLEDEADREAARRQAICPVSDEPLGSMGKPVKLTVEGEEVFICCAACEDALLAEPQKYLERLHAGHDH